jgi:hypothetical protein
LVDVTRNSPDSRAEFDRFPPSEYPIELYLGIGKRNAGLLRELKPILDGQPKEDSKYTARVLRHIGNSISMRCYFRDVDSLRPVVWQLKGYNTVRELVGGSTSFTPRMLIEKAQSILGRDMGAAR